MDTVFKALADANRRALLDRLNARNGQNLRELCVGLAKNPAGSPDDNSPKQHGAQARRPQNPAGSPDDNTPEQHGAQADPAGSSDDGSPDAQAGRPLSRQAVSKHLAVLEAAALVTTVRRGREKLHYLNPVPIQELADRWIHHYERGRMAALRHLKQTLENPVTHPEFVYVIYIQTTTEQLYRALTEPEFTSAYHGGYGPDSDWQIGSSVRWKMDPDGEFEELGQRVLEAEPGRRLTYTWHTLQPMHRDLFDSDEAFTAACRERSTVAFDIEPAEEPEMGVKLTITHNGFDGPDSEMLKGVSGGWIMIASALKTLLEGGRLVSAPS